MEAMGIFSRLGTLIKSNINDLITKAEDPEKMLTQVCNVAQQAQQRGPAAPSLADVLGSSSAMPEATAAKRGGSTFDTLNGNVLTR